MILHDKSHLDHGLTSEQTAYIFELFASRDGFFIETVELPDSLGTVPCGLYGPLMGDPPITSAYHSTADGRDLLSYERRGTREYTSRVVDLPPRPTRKVTVIAGPHDEHACILYTAFGGPLTPQEPNDPTCKDPAASSEVWQYHALAK